jgi:autotransporter-associated beta strand protein
LGLIVDPESDVAGGIKRSGIHLDGIDVSIDESLYIDATVDDLVVHSSALSLDSSEGVGGSLTLTGNSVDVGGVTRLSAAGAKGGGMIQVGGSWQNSDPSVRQATTSTVGTDVEIDASAIKQGDGGEIVVWSDVLNPESKSTVSGFLKAHGGVDGGNGGRIETSGYELSFPGIRLDLAGIETGEWLLDPFDYVLDNSPPDFATSTIAQVLSEGIDVSISTVADQATVGSSSISSTSAGTGNITVNAPISVTSGTSSGSLTLTADDKIFIQSDITNTVGGGNLTLSSQFGVVIGVGNTMDWNPGPGGQVKIESLDTVVGGLSGSGNISIFQGKLEVYQDGFSQFDGVIDDFGGGGGLLKSGSGTLILPGDHKYSGLTEIVGGLLEFSGLSNNNSDINLSDGASVLFSVPDGESRAYSGAITGCQNCELQKAGLGVFELSESQQFEGEVYVDEGSFLSAGLGDFTIAPTRLHLYPGTTYQLKDGFGTDVVQALPGVCLETPCSGDEDLLQGDIVLGAGSGLAVGHLSDLDTSFRGVISGEGDLYKYGSGFLELSGSNTYSGNTFVLEGELRVENPQALGSSIGATYVDPGAELVIQPDVAVSDGSDFVLAEPVFLAGGFGSASDEGIASEAVLRFVGSSGSSATISQPIEFSGQAAIEAVSGRLLLGLDDSVADNMIVASTGCVEGPCSIRIGGDSTGKVETFQGFAVPTNSDKID